MEQPTMHEQERDQEPPHTTVAIDERVDGFELGVSEPDVDQDRQLVLLVEEALEVVESRMHLRERGRHEGRSFNGRVLRSDPVLMSAELSG